MPWKHLTNEIARCDHAVLHGYGFKDMDRFCQSLKWKWEWLLHSHLYIGNDGKVEHIVSNFKLYEILNSFKVEQNFKPCTTAKALSQIAEVNQYFSSFPFC